MVEGRQVQVGGGLGHVAGQGVLHRCVDGEDVELVHFAELSRERGGGGHVADFPAGDVVGFAEAADDERARRQAGKAHRAVVHGAQGGVKHHVFIDLVADEQHVGGCQQGLQSQHFGFGPDGGAGVVRRVDDDGAGFGAERGGDLVEVRAEGTWRERYAHDGAAGQLDVGHIAVVAGLEHDDLVARMHDAQNDGDDGLRSAGGDGDLGGRVVAAAVQGLNFGGDGFAQHGHARHGRVLVQAALHGSRHRVNQRRVTFEVWKALAQVDGVLFSGQRRHDGEDGGAHVGQAALQGGGVLAYGGEGRAHGF